MPGANDPKSGIVELSLVTGTVDRPASIYRLISSVQALTTVSYELIIVDASKQPLTCHYPHVRIIREWPRQGCVKGYNQGFRAAVGRWVMYLNDDAEVLPLYDRAAILFMEAHPKIGLGALHYSENGNPFAVNSYLDMVYANFGIISRELGNEIGWFDEDITMYGNDNSLTFRVLLAGKGVADIPDARVVHHSVQDQVRIGNQEGRYKDNLILGRKYLPYRRQMERTYREALA